MGLIQTPPIKLQIQVITVTRNHESILRIDYPSGATFFRFISSAFDNKKIDVTHWSRLNITHYEHFNRLIQLQFVLRISVACSANIFRVSMTQETASPWRVRVRERERERVCASVCAVHPCDSYMGALEADGVGRWKRLTLGSRCYRFGRSMEPERSQINLYTRFPLFRARC